MRHSNFEKMNSDGDMSLTNEKQPFSRTRAPTVDLEPSETVGKFKLNFNCMSYQ